MRCGYLGRVEAWGLGFESPRATIPFGSRPEIYDVRLLID